MRKVAFLVLPECSNLGLAAATEPLFVANWLSQRRLFDWKVISVDGGAVRASNGREIAVDGSLSTAEDCKTVFVLASFDPQRLVGERPAVRWLKRIARFGVEIGGIENGSLILAEAGLLHGHEAAIHWDNLMGFQEHYPDTRALPQLFVRSRDRITCAGASAILDMMCAWIGWHGEKELAAEVAEHLLLGQARPGETAQRAIASAKGVAADRAGAVADAVVSEARALMSRHVDEPLSCRDIARHVGMSLRQLQRRFREELRCSVLQEYRQIRLAKAHQLLQQTELSVTQIALSCGFVSPEYFCRLYRHVFGCSPSRDRRQSTTAPVLRQHIARSRAEHRETPGPRSDSPAPRHDSPGRRHDSPGPRHDSPGRRRDSPGPRHKTTAAR